MQHHTYGDGYTPRMRKAGGRLFQAVDARALDYMILLDFLHIGLFFQTEPENGRTPDNYCLYDINKTVT